MTIKDGGLRGVLSVCYALKMSLFRDGPNTLWIITDF